MRLILWGHHKWCVYVSKVTVSVVQVSIGAAPVLTTRNMIDFHHTHGINLFDGSRDIFKGLEAWFTVLEMIRLICELANGREALAGLG